MLHYMEKRDGVIIYIDVDETGKITRAPEEKARRQKTLPKRRALLSYPKHEGPADAGLPRQWR